MLDSVPEQIELLETDIEDVEDGVDAQHFTTGNDIEMEVGDILDNPVRVNAQYFIAASVEQEVDDEMRKAMLGEEYIDEASIFISDEDGSFENEAGLFKVDGADLDDVIDEFAERYL